MINQDKFENLCDRISRILTSTKFILIVAPLIIVTRLLSGSPADPDLFARIAMGRLTIKSAAVPLTDPFAFTPTLPMWIDHEWLAGVVFYIVAAIGGDFGLITLRVALAALATICIIYASLRYSPLLPSRFIWIAICVLHAASAWTSTVRCQAFTYLLVPVLFLAMIEARQHANHFLLRLTPIISLAWINMHGGYALGACLIAIFCCAQILERRLNLVAIATAIGWAIAPIFTPYGAVNFIKFLWHSLGMQRPGILEWEPLYHDLPSFYLTIIVFTPIVIGVICNKGKRDPFGLMILAFASYCAFRHTRFLPFMMISCAIFGGPYLENSINRIRSFSPRLSLSAIRCGSFTIALALMLGAINLVILLSSPSTYRLNFAGFPIGAIEWLRTSGARGNLLVDFNLGSYALWRLYPNFKISVDGRYEEAYPPETVRDNALAFRPDLAASRDILQRFAPSHILVPTSHNISDPERAFGADWHLVYRDPDAVVLAREARDEVATSINYRTTPNNLWRPQF